MNRRLQGCVGLMLVAMSATAFAESYEYLGFKMLNARDDPFRYYLDARNSTPAGIALSEVERATEAAFKTWEDAPCAYPDFTYVGRSSTNSAITDVRDPYDAFNVAAIWVTSPADSYYDFALAGGNVPSGTVPLTYAGYLYQCDIYLNAVNYRWTTLPNTSPSEKLLDLQTALTHEVGHCLGLADVYYPSTAVMEPNFPFGGNKRALDAHDLQHVCDYYPENGAVGSPCSPSDPCTNGLTCISRTTASGGTAQYCSKRCDNLTPGECPSPFACRPSSAISGATYACLAVPNEAVTQVGKQCNTASECGSPRSICKAPETLPSTGTAWVGGYCQEACASGSSVNSCPGGSVCVNLDPTGDNDRCLKRCRPGSGDCRDGYTCSPLVEGNVCVPKCYANADCNSSGSSAFLCRQCDNVCIRNQLSGRAIGDPCDNTTPCGPGQVCLFVNNHSQGICAQPCATADCTCPTGTTCRAVGPDRMCMRDCAVGTCTQPLQCNPLGDGYSCMPPCRSDAECPNGMFCGGGRCYDRLQPTDAGCTLCSDAGQPPPPPGDGGTGGGDGDDDSPEGCGCSGAPASAAFFTALALLLIGGRRSWPRR